MGSSRETARLQHIDETAPIPQAQASLDVKTTPSFALRWLLQQEGLPNGIAVVPRWKGIAMADRLWRGRSSPAADSSPRFPKPMPAA